MERVVEKSVEVRDGLASHSLHRDNEKSEPFDVTDAREDIRRHKRYRAMLSAEYTRLKRLRETILGPGTIDFPGLICILDNYNASLNDMDRLRDIREAIDNGNAAAYWTDGSHFPDGHPKAGFLGAAVVVVNATSEQTGEYALGRYTGDSTDAELFAIGAALDHAKKAIQKGRTLTLTLIRIFTDAQRLLKAIHTGSTLTLGPLLSTPKTSLESFYERASWLANRGVKIQLEWVKAHAASSGNQAADQLARAAARNQEASLRRTDLWHPEAGNLSRLMAEADVPAPWRDLGRDWVDEWLWRANRGLLATDELSSGRLEACEDVVRRWEERSLSDEDEMPAPAKAASGEIPDGEWVGDDLLDILEDERSEADRMMEGDVEKQMREDMARADLRMGRTGKMRVLG
ncbi:hypothetical protein CC86DRAFT_201814 [Ophiobolus disseminans]|uniref:RNase H type-1 domain-containing protein n=1 Tax=Ophiobolus disseminans TaxID=1469910 RepID=A0A6A7A5P7_9PLEO|nr:hypothetical protein CC86DRAFT_201814 [Ophiobolus disseminans]